jgi:hypothetical protein
MLLLSDRVTCGFLELKKIKSVGKTFPAEIAMVKTGRLPAEDV